MPRRKRNVDIALIIALVVAMAELVSSEHTLAQATTYTVVELSAADVGLVPCRLNNLGDFVGRAGDSGAMLWSHGSLKPRHLGCFARRRV